MKTLKVLLLSSILGLGAVFGAGQANAYSEGSANSTCDGTSDYWGGYFYASTSLWAEVRDDNTFSQNRSFSFAGFLEGFEHAGAVNAFGSHVIYRSGWLDLAVPYQVGADLEIRDNRYDHDTTEGQWYTLCEF
ncbi:hypothetical protein [Nocardia sp. XZ_19_385]|uniref:hypothetical protein n=1 Tax=Nocardia sp. XZ_19_385 TaxID=2769488 RepID=UPI00188EF322|nr:hypothetical protein [Nocardia sp. XZ_19_385]